jgi:hypothetical protein
MRETEAWPAGRLAPLVAGLVELLPWLRQWHNDGYPETAIRMGDSYAQFVDEEARSLGVTLAALRSWSPDAPARRATGKRGRQT